MKRIVLCGLALAALAGVPARGAEDGGVGTVVNAAETVLVNGRPRPDLMITTDDQGGWSFRYERDLRAEPAAWLDKDAPRTDMRWQGWEALADKWRNGQFGGHLMYALEFPPPGPCGERVGAGVQFRRRTDDDRGHLFRTAGLDRRRTGLSADTADRALRRHAARVAAQAGAGRALGGEPAGRKGTGGRGAGNSRLDTGRARRTPARAGGGRAFPGRPDPGGRGRASADADRAGRQRPTRARPGRRNTDDRAADLCRLRAAPTVRGVTAGGAGWLENREGRPSTQTANQKN